MLVFEMPHFSYADFLLNAQKSFRERTKDKPLFSTNAKGLFTAYLEGIPQAYRQEHTCACCRKFIETYGDLAYLDDDLKVRSALWEYRGAYKTAFETMQQIVEQSKIIAVHHSPDPIWGDPITGDWLHLSVLSPKVYKHPTNSASQQQALSKEHFQGMVRALVEYKDINLDTVVALLESNALYRSEKVLGPAKFLAELSAKWRNARRANVIWSAIATAPEGFLHPRSSMIGTLLEDLAKGRSIEKAMSSFAAKMHPLQYQRPTAAPTTAAIMAAEAAFNSLGLEDSLKRRFAHLEEVPKLWEPKVTPEVGGTMPIFGKLLPEAPATVLPGVQLITWVKFLAEVLPTAISMEFHASREASYYSTFLTATVPEAPPIFQWDSEEARNPFSWYFKANGVKPEEFNLSSDTWHKVNAICESPTKGFSHFGQHIMFVIDGARDLKPTALGLFPEMLKSFLRPFQAVIEKYSGLSVPTGAETASVAGPMLTKDLPWNLQLRVKSPSFTRLYTIDRWE